MLTYQVLCPPNLLHIAVFFETRSLTGDPLFGQSSWLASSKGFLSLPSQWYDYRCALPLVSAGDTNVGLCSPSKRSTDCVVFLHPALFVLLIGVLVVIVDPKAGFSCVAQAGLEFTL